MREHLRKKAHYIEGLEKIFGRYPARKAVVLCMLRNGLRVGEKGDVLCGDIEISPAKLARHLRIDRRIVNDTVSFILSDKELKGLFTRIRPMARIDEFASGIGLGVVRIHVSNARAPDLVYRITGVVSGFNIPIKQLIAEDPELGYEPSLVLVLEEPLPPKLITELKRLDFISRMEVL